MSFRDGRIETDTIFAVATAPGRSGVAVVRISGPSANAAALALAGSLPEERKAAVRTLSDPATGEVIDEALVIRFGSPRSFTGEDVVELQVHGSPAVLRLVSEALGEMQGLRPAMAGEFTRRALQQGRLDLGQVEGLGDLLTAETDAQHRQAIRQLRGGTGALAKGWRDRLVEVAAQVAAMIDFADEEVPQTPGASLKILGEVAEEMAAEIRGSRVAERLRDGFEVALVGPPNVGKSSLINRLACRETALVTEVPGTTRDVLEVRLDLEGLLVTVLDMAGLHAATDRVEQLGMERARSRAAMADLRIFLLEDTAQMTGLGVAFLEGDLQVLAKADLRESAEGAVSGTTGAGVTALLQRIGGIFGQRAAGAGTASRERHRHAITQARAEVLEAAEAFDHGEKALEIGAEHIRRALSALDELAGAVTVDRMLDAIFAKFCLGK